MVSEKKKGRLDTALSRLNDALEAYRKASDNNELEFLALSKAFEVAIEYAWRELKTKVEDDGLDAPSPKAAVKQAAKLGLISEAQDWLACIDARNDSVHDYFGIPEADYVRLAEKFVTLAKAIK